MILSIVLLITVCLSVACCVFQIVAIKKLNEITEKEKRKIATMQANNIALFENMKKLYSSKKGGDE